MSENTFDMGEFVNVVFPTMLRRFEGYHVKGGRAFDKFFKLQSGSIDWDIMCTNESALIMNQALKEYADEMGLELITLTFNIGEYTVWQHGFKDYFYSSEANDPYFADFTITEKPLKYLKLDGIRYIPFDEFFSDLMYTLNNRHATTLGKINRSTRFFISNIEQNTNSIRFFTKFEDPLDAVFYASSYLTTELSLMLINHILISWVDQVVISPFQLATSKFMNGVITKREYESIIFELKVFDYYGEGLKTFGYNEYFNYQYNYIDSLMRLVFFGNVDLIFDSFISQHLVKFAKTLTRYESFERLLWDSFSDTFKISLLIQCTGSKEMAIFNINEKCKASLDCKNRTLQTDFSGCFDPVQREQFTKTSKYANY